VTPTPRPPQSSLRKKMNRSSLRRSQSTPSLLPSQPNSQEWFQNRFQMPKVSSPVQTTLNQKEPIILAFLTSKEMSIPLRIMLLDSLYQLMGTVNRQLTIVNLYWTYVPIAGNESFHPALADVKTFDDIVNRLNYVNEYAKLKIDDSTIERLAILWRLLMDPNYSAAICMTAREVYNNQVGDLVEVLGNVLSLRWDSRTTTQPGGNIDQLVIDLLRQILNSDVERYYDRAINGIDNCNFRTRRCRPCAQNFMAVSMWHVPNRSTLDRRWGTDFITDTMINMDRIAVLLRHIKDNINTVNRNADRISGVNPEGIKPHNFSNSQLTRIGRVLNKLDENPADSTDWCFICYKQPKEEPVQLRTPILHHPLPTRPPPALPPHQQWMPPPPPHLRPSPPLPPNPPPTQSTLLTAMNALQKSTGFLWTTSAINHRSGSRQPRTSHLSFTPPTPLPAPRSSATSRMNTVALRALRGSLTTSTGQTRTSSTSTRTHQST
jgi:hypothetical protein